MTDLVVRDNYFERQYLRPQDFSDEQAYHVALRRQHNLAGHTWGIVHGLRLGVLDGTPYVEPGLAVDGYGRELVLTERARVPVQSFVQLGRDLLDVWLYYDKVAGDTALAGCGESGLPARWIERPVVRLAAPTGAEDPRRPPGVPDADLSFPPSRLAPDDPEHIWPVFLGRLAHDRRTPGSPYVPDTAGRPYAGLVGAEITAPSGLARVQIGAEQDGDTRRFAVWLPAGERTRPRLEIGEEGELTVHGDARVDGGLTVGGAVEFVAGPAATAPAPGSLALVQGDGGGDDLRVEIPEGGSVAVGHWDEDAQAFHACLTVGDDCTVRVSGDLVVEGRLETAGGLPDQGLSPDARRAVLSTFLTGVGGANVLLDRFYRSRFPGGPDEVATALAQDPELRTALASALREHAPGVADELGRALLAQGEAG